MKFSLDILEQAKISYVNIKNRIQTKIKSWDISNEGKRNYYYDKIFSSLLDDLNMPMALSHFQTMLKDNEIGSADVELLTKEFDKIAWLDLLVTESTDIPSEVRDMAEQRKIAKQNKDRTESDRIRDEIIKLWFTIKDTKEWYGIVKI